MRVNAKRSLCDECREYKSVTVSIGSRNSSIPSRDVFSCERGHIVIEWPSELTDSDCGFVAEWLAMIHHRIKSRIQPPSPQPERTDDGK